MFNKTKRILALLLALVMVFALAACGNNGGEESEEVEIIYDYVTESGEDAGDASGDDASDGDASSDDGASSKDDTPTGKVDPKKYKGTTVRYATWLDPQLNEDGPVVKAFEKKYDIKVQIDIVSQDDYPNLIAGMISSGDSPDVYFSNNTFPSDMACLQPLSAAKLDMDDEIWNKTTFKLTTYDNEPYLCDTMGNIWAENDLLYYNKSLLAQANVNTPEQYDAAGKWSWDAVEEIATACSQLPGITGLAMMTPDSFAGAAGCNIYDNNNGKFENGMNDQLKACYRRMAQWYKDGILKTGWRDGFIDGKVAMSVTHSFGLKKTGHWKNMNWNNVGFYTIPPVEAGGTAYQTGCFRGWGIIRGAENPVAAGIFLRYYLDPNNYDNDLAFISPEAETFFYKTTYIEGDNYNPYWTFGGGSNAASGLEVSEIFQCPYFQDPTQIDSFINSKMNSVDNAVKNMNDFTDKEKGFN